MSNAQLIYNAVKRIPAGKISTYGQIAQFIGQPQAPRMVGKVLHNNPDPSVIKCHRIVKKDGSLSEGFAFGGIQKHAQLLASEGIPIDMKKYRVINVDKYMMDFNN